MIDFVELQNLGHRLIDIVRNLKERKVCLRHQPELEKIFRQKFHPGLPIIAARPVEHEDRNDARLAGLHERQDLERLVHRSEAAREQRKRMRFFDEVQLAIKKIIEIDQLRIALDDFVRLLLERQSNV